MNWAFAPSATPVERYTGVGHLRDPLVTAVQLRPMWNALGLPAFGAEVRVESNAPPFACTPQLMTDLEPRDPGDPQAYHGVMVVDARTPLAPDGTPALRAVWESMLTAPTQPVSLGIERRSPGQLRLIFRADDGRFHQLKYSTNLAGWSDFSGPSLGQGNVTNIVVSNSVPRGFWRIQVR